jgi:hypothetical protein
MKKKIVKQNDVLGTFVDAGLIIEKLRVQLQVRQTHLKKQERKDADADWLLEQVIALEKQVDSKVSELLKVHPAYKWFSGVKGIGKENIGKVVGLIDIEKANTISSLWKFAGYAVDTEGRAPRMTRGVKLEYNAKLRSNCWRVATSLLRAKGKYYTYYLEQKERYVQRFTNEGYSIMPASQLPKTKQGEGKVISEGHIHNMALRKTIKMFLAHLWLVWREEEGLPITKPYSIDIIKHDTFIGPWEFVEKKKPSIKRAAKKK